MRSSSRRAGVAQALSERDNWDDHAARNFEQVCPIEKERWGVWAVSFQLAMGSRDNVRQNLALVTPARG
jgi:hypothetical protein